MIVHPICCPRAETVTGAANAECCQCGSAIVVSPQLQEILEACERGGDGTKRYCDSCFTGIYLPRSNPGTPESWIELEAMKLTATLAAREGITDPLDTQNIFECFWRILRKRAALPQDITLNKWEHQNEETNADAVRKLLATQ